MSKEFLSLEEDDRLLPVLEDDVPESLCLELPPDMLEVDCRSISPTGDFDEILSAGFLQHNDPFLSYREDSLDSPLDSLSSNSDLTNEDDDYQLTGSEDLVLLHPSVWAEEEGLAPPLPPPPPLRPEASSLATLLQSNLLPSPRHVKRATFSSSSTSSSASLSTTTGTQANTASTATKSVHFLHLLPDLYHNYSIDRQAAATLPSNNKRTSCYSQFSSTSSSKKIKTERKTSYVSGSSSVLLNLLLKGEDLSHGYQCPTKSSLQRHSGATKLPS